MAIVLNNMLNTASTPLPAAAGGSGSQAIPVNGQLLIGDTATGAFVAASVSAGAGISITPGAGTLQIDNTAVAGMSWAAIAGASQAAAVNTGYVNQNALSTVITLPATAALGDVVAVQGLGAAGWVLTANAGQTIQVGQSSTSIAGTVSSVANYDCIEVVCVVADTSWAMRFGVTSGFSIA